VPGWTKNKNQKKHRRCTQPKCSLQKKLRMHHSTSDKRCADFSLKRAETFGGRQGFS